ACIDYPAHQKESRQHGCGFVDDVSGKILKVFVASLLCRVERSSRENVFHIQEIENRRPGIRDWAIPAPARTLRERRANAHQPFKSERVRATRRGDAREPGALRPSKRCIYCIDPEWRRRLIDKAPNAFEQFAAAVERFSGYFWIG